MKDDVKEILLAILSVNPQAMWTSFCENYLVAEYPPDKIAREKRKASPEHEKFLTMLYRSLGAKAFYGSRVAAIDLRYVGDELRAYQIGEDALADYGKYER